MERYQHHYIDSEYLTLIIEQIINLQLTLTIYNNFSNRPYNFRVFQVRNCCRQISDHFLRYKCLDFYLLQVMLTNFNIQNLDEKIDVQLKDLNLLVEQALLSPIVDY